KRGFGFGWRKVLEEQPAAAFHEAYVVWMFLNRGLQLRSRTVGVAARSERLDAQQPSFAYEFGTCLHVFGQRDGIIVLLSPQENVAQSTPAGSIGRNCWDDQPPLRFGLRPFAHVGVHGSEILPRPVAPD